MGLLAAQDLLAFKNLPNWRGFFLNQTYDDGVTERIGGTLVVKAAVNEWQWTLKEVSSCLMLRLSTRTWDEGIMLLEELLGAKEAPWQPDPWEQARKSPHKKRG